MFELLCLSHPKKPNVFHFSRFFSSIFTDAQLVFIDKNEAFQMLKIVRESRVKPFKTREEAERFSLCGLESPTDTELPIIINAEINGIPINHINNINCDKNLPKGLLEIDFDIAKKCNELSI